MDLKKILYYIHFNNIYNKIMKDGAIITFNHILRNEEEHTGTFIYYDDIKINVCVIFNSENDYIELNIEKNNKPIITYNLTSLLEIEADDYFKNIFQYKNISVIIKKEEVIIIYGQNTILSNINFKNNFIIESYKDLILP